MSNLLNGQPHFDRSIIRARLDSKFRQTLIPILPEHIIIDNILPRLPGKSLIRFKIVSKLWLSIITSIDFAKSHLKFSSLSPKYVVHLDDKFFLLPSDNNINMSELRLEVDGSVESTSVNLVGCCHGLLCFTFIMDERYCFCVWNPVTQQCRKIMIPYDDNYHYVSGYGFSYASSIDDYKIVASFYNDDGNVTDVAEDHVVYYFSLRSSQWKKIVGLHNTIEMENIREFRNTPFCPFKNLKYWKKDKFIGGFDLVHEKWIQIPGLDWLTPYWKVNFFGWKECVSLFCHGDHGSDVWVFKRYGDQNSWEKMFSVNLTDVRFYNMPEMDTLLVKRKGSSELIMVDLHENAQVESGVVTEYSGKFYGSVVYVESLVSPFIPNE